MRIVRTLVIVALLTGATLASTTSTPDVSGTWDLEMAWGEGAKSTGVCTFEQDGETLTGICGGDQKFSVKGNVENSRVSWEVAVEHEDGQARMQFSGQLDGSGRIIKGSCSIVGGQDGTFTLTRKP